jgi:DNA-binding MarR family transcriptional regulator
VASKHERAREAWVALSDLFFGHRSHDRFPAVASELDLTPSQMHLLLHLTRDGDGRPMRTLTTVMRCDPSYVTTTVDALERRGCLERRISPADRRVKLVFVTAEGRLLGARAVDRLSVPPADFDNLTMTDLEQLRALLAKLAGGDDLRA